MLLKRTLYIFFALILFGKFSFSQEKNTAETLFPFKYKGKYGFMDKQGKEKIVPQFDEAYLMNSDLTIVRLGGVYGFINRSGKYEVNPQFEALRDFEGELAPAKIRENGVL